MKGFSDKALLLFPLWDNYTAHSESYKYKFKKCLTNMVDYLHTQGMSVHAFMTDDVALEYKSLIDEWISPLSKADRFFTSKHCEGMQSAMQIKAIEYPDIYAECARKDAGSTDMSVTERFDLVTKHCKQACSAIIPEYNVVVHFQTKSKLQYKVTSKPGDKRIRIDVDASTFVPKVFMAGSEVPACDVLGVPYANRNLECWEVHNEKG